MKLKLITRRLLCKAGIACAGRIGHEKDSNGIWWIGLRCVYCGKLCHPVRSAYQDKPKTGEAST